MTEKSPRNTPLAILRRLKREFPLAQCTLNFQTPLEMLIATILSAQCTDKRVNMVTPTLFKRYRNSEEFANAELSELEEIIRSTGFYHNKAKHIIALCRILCEEYHGEIPKTMEALTVLPGVGRKTANVLLGNAFGIASGFVVDTHVGRLARRIGLSPSTDPKKIEQDLCEIFPKKEWITLSHRLIQLGRSHCKAQRPDCEHCPLADLCPKISLNK